MVERRVIIELSLLAVLTVVFLLVFPERPMRVEVGLSLFALTLLLLNLRYTKYVIWKPFPCVWDRRFRLRKALLLVGAVTGLAVIGLFVGGLLLGGRAEGWEMAAQRVGNWRVLLAFALFFPWALLQQTLFQFYLLGRLLTLFPASIAITCTGITYGLVHLPDIGVTLATTVAGIVWTYVYYRVLSPLAFSHALLGTLFYYWIYGRDLAKEWAVGL
ncbi:MAG: type II CAAX prenyl endopeptidase Rce1 family protein [Chromatiales bacterium]